MNVTLPPALERRVREKVERGDYRDSDALMQEAVHRLIEDDEAEEAIRERLRAADAEIDLGEGLEFDEHSTRTLIESIQQRGIARLTKLRETERPR